MSLFEGTLECFARYVVELDPVLVLRLEAFAQLDRQLVGQLAMSKQLDAGLVGNS
jgi:hypothetical protein